MPSRWISSRRVCLIVSAAWRSCSSGLSLVVAAAAVVAVATGAAIIVVDDCAMAMPGFDVLLWDSA